jgi:hypothetical protein
MRKRFLTIAALTVFMATAPALAQEEPSATPAPSTEQQAPAENKEAPKDATRKAEPAAHPRRVSHYRYGLYAWPWTWVWYHLRYPFYYHHHRT